MLIDNYLALVNAVARNTERTTLNVYPERVSQTLLSLTTREQAVLMMRYGLGGGNAPMKLEKVARSHKTTRERIRQIEAGALNKLRRPHLFRLLTDTTSFDEIFQQPLILEWVHSERSVKHFTAMSWFAEMNQNGWRFPFAKEIQSAIRDGVAKFSSPSFASYHWVVGRNSVFEPIVVKIHGASFQPAPDKRYACLALVRCITKTGYLVD